MYLNYFTTMRQILSGLVVSAVYWTKLQDFRVHCNFSTLHSVIILYFNQLTNYYTRLPFETSSLKTPGLCNRPSGIYIFTGVSEKTSPCWFILINLLRISHKS